MNPTHFCRSLFLLLTLATGLACAAQSAKDIQPGAEARWMTEDTSPAAQYNRSKHEAHAAYSEAVKQCRQMTGTEKTACLKEAKANLQNDLAYAKQSFNRARQLTPLSSPVAKYNNAVREAYAAYDEASNYCGSMPGGEKAACIKRAKARLQDDLAYAKTRLTAESSIGSSGAAGSTLSGDAAADSGSRNRAR